MYTGIVELDKEFLMSQIHFPIKTMKNRHLWENKDWQAWSADREAEIKHVPYDYEGLTVHINF